MNRFESLRRIWSPGREIDQVVADLDPQSELDSLIRDYFSRIVFKAKTITLDLDEPNHGTVNWEVVSVPIGNGQFKKQATIWWEPDARTALIEKLSN